jgi:hypothetical protein
MTTSLKTFSVSNRARDVERRTTLNPIEPASRMASPRTAAWVNTCARFEHPRTASDDGYHDDMKVFILMHIIRLRDRRSCDRDRCSLPTPTRALTLRDLALDVHVTRTLPVERKYCANATTNSCAGTSFTVRGALVVAMVSTPQASLKDGTFRAGADLHRVCPPKCLGVFPEKLYF